MPALPAPRIAAARAEVASLLANEAGCAAFGALPEALVDAPGTWRGGRGELRHLEPRLGGQLLHRALGVRHEADVDHMPLDDAADCGEERGHVAALHPAAAARIEHRLQLLHHEADIAAAPEHRRDHPREADGPGVVLHVLGVDEDLERAAAAVLDDVVDGYVE